MSLDTDQLLMLVATGDRDAYARLHQQLGAVTYGITLSILHDPDKASDAQQEAWLRIWRQARRYDNRLGPARAWVCTIARNEAKRLYVRDTPHQHLTLDGDRKDRALAVVDEGPQQLLDQDEMRRRIIELGLDDIDRLLIWNLFYEDCTQQETADLMQLPLGTVKSRTRRILRLFRERYNDA